MLMTAVAAPLIQHVNMFGFISNAYPKLIMTCVYQQYATLLTDLQWRACLFGGDRERGGGRGVKERRRVGQE